MKAEPRVPEHTGEVSFTVLRPSAASPVTRVPLTLKTASKGMDIKPGRLWSKGKILASGAQECRDVCVICVCDFILLLFFFIKHM